MINDNEGVTPEESEDVAAEETTESTDAQADGDGDAGESDDEDDD